jgi:hypothetical protein
MVAPIDIKKPPTAFKPTLAPVVGTLIFLIAEKLTRRPSPKRRVFRYVVATNRNTPAIAFLPKSAFFVFFGTLLKNFS